MKAFFRALLVLTLLAGFSHVAVAAEAVARATFVSGSVQARSGSGEMRTLIRGGELHRGDTIVTGDGASAQLTFADNSRIAVRASTEFAIDDFRMGNDEGFILRLTRGALRSITGLIGQRNKGNFSLRTPVATIGIRGTDFEAVHIPEGGANAFGGGVDPGTYNKVYAGGTQLVSKAGKIDLNINEIGFIGIGGSAGAGPVKIDQLPPGIIKVINAAPIVSKTDAAPADAGAPGTSEAKASSSAGTVDADTSTLQLDTKPVTTTKLPTTTLNSTTIKSLDVKTLDSTSIKTLDSSTLGTTTLDKSTLTNTTLDSSTLKSTTTLSPTTTTVSPTTTTITTLPKTTTTISPTTIDTTKLNTTTIKSTTLPSTTTIKLDSSTKLTK
jgi:hypothetical protein